jgi:hypothetical protein
MSAAIVGDLILGMSCFSAISLGALWYFSMGWLHLVSLYAAAGLTFGAVWQWDLAWIGAWTTLPLLGFVVYLASRALRLPPAVYRAGKNGTVRVEIVAWLHAHHGARHLGIRG